MNEKLSPHSGSGSDDGSPVFHAVNATIDANSDLDLNVSVDFTILNDEADERHATIILEEDEIAVGRFCLNGDGLNDFISRQRRLNSQLERGRVKESPARGIEDTSILQGE
jgi:hypothetical protein